VPSPKGRAAGFLADSVDFLQAISQRTPPGIHTTGSEMLQAVVEVLLSGKAPQRYGISSTRM